MRERGKKSYPCGVINAINAPRNGVKLWWCRHVPGIKKGYKWAQQWKQQLLVHQGNESPNLRESVKAYNVPFRAAGALGENPFGKRTDTDQKGETPY